MILYQTKTFNRDTRKIKMSNKHFTKFIQYLYLLSESKPLPSEARDHGLKGNWINFRECHISGDLLLIYQIEDDIIKLVRIGSHSQLFKNK